VGADQYKAFISYSHKDRAWAKWLHRRLESYAFPKNLIGSQTAIGEVPRNLRPIFRDREELAAGHNLGEKIEAALKASKNLIIICSPNAAQSHWVNQEILYFKRHNRGAEIFSVIVEGEPFASKSEEECFPESLRFEIDQAGELSGQPAEPLAADLRDRGDGKRLGVLKLISGMAGLGVNDLVQRDLQRARRRVTTITASAAAIVLAMGGLTWTAIDARNEAEKRQAIAEDQIEFMLSDLRQEVEKVGRLDALMIVGERALSYYRENPPSKSDVKTILRHAKGKSLMGQVLLREKKFAEAKSHFDDAYVQVSSSDIINNANALFELSQISFWQSSVEFEQENFKSALTYSEIYLKHANRLVELNPDNIDWQLEELYARQNIASIYFRMGDNSAAAKIIDQIIPEIEKMRKLKGDPEFLKNLAFIYAWVAHIYEDIDMTETIKYRTTQLAIVNQLLSNTPEDSTILFDKLQAVAGLANVYLKAKNYEASQTLIEHNLETSEQLTQLDSRNLQYEENYQILKSLLEQAKTKLN